LLRKLTLFPKPPSCEDFFGGGANEGGMIGTGDQDGQDAGVQRKVRAVSQGLFVRGIARNSRVWGYKMAG